MRGANDLVAAYALVAYAGQTVWNIWNYQNATWGGRPYPWTGWSTDNPGDNYYYSFLAATMYWALANDASICSGTTTCRDFLAAQPIPELETYFSNLPTAAAAKAPATASRTRTCSCSIACGATARSRTSPTRTAI